MEKTASAWSPAFFVENRDDCLNYIKVNYYLVPYLNVNDYERIGSSSLVRFRGMVQDMYDPEYYLEKCEVINTVTNNTYSKNGKYVDVLDCKEDEVLDVDNKKNVSSERQTYVVISTPAVNSWVKTIEESKYKIELRNESDNSGIKRPLESPEETDVEMGPEAQPVKKVRNGTNGETPQPTLSREHFLNFPIPEESGKTCHIKIYEKDDSNIKLNEVYDFIGFLSNDTTIPNQATHDDDFGMEMEIQTHNPPVSLVPRIHCIFWNKVETVNPLVHDANLTDVKIKFLRKELHMILTEILMGDELAASYLLYYLLSKVYLRRDLMPLGTFTVNISNIPVKVVGDYPGKLYQLLERIVSKSHYFPMTLGNMNDLTFTPKKDYNCNRLTSGLLQLSEGTHLILDETKLSAGKLNESGVKAVSAITHIIKGQKVAYDFNYHTMEFDCDIPILILSEGKSLLPSDSQIVLKPSDIHVGTMDEIFDAVDKLLNPELLNDIRAYLTISRNRPYEISDNMLEIIQNGFVNLRQTRKIGADDLHHLLVLSRLVCIGEGKSTLNEECWKIACELEDERKARL